MSTRGVRTIGELAQQGALEFGDGYRTKRSEHAASGYRIVRVADVSDGAVQLDGPDFVSPAFARSIGGKAGRPGDILLTTKGTVGRVAIVPELHEAIVYSPQLCYFRVRDAEVIDPRYLSFWFKSGEFVHQAAHRMNNTDMAAYINLADIRSLMLRLPDLDEQHAIAEVLGALDDKIAVNNTLAETLADLISAKFAEASLSSVADIRLSEIVRTQYGVTTSAHDGEGPRFLRVTDINKKPWITWDSTPSCTVTSEDLAKYRVEAGDILVARMADPGKAAFIDDGDPVAVFASYLVRLRAIDPDQSVYIYYFLRSTKYREYSEGVMQGSVQMSMNAKVIVATDIPMPSSEVITQFNQAVGVLRKSIQAALRENRVLAATRDALLPQLMSGALRAKDVDEVLEGVL
jgi:type I restriction enzyme S subunit